MFSDDSSDDNENVKKLEQKIEHNHKGEAIFKGYIFQNWFV